MIDDLFRNWREYQFKNFRFRNILQHTRGFLEKETSKMASSETGKQSSVTEQPGKFSGQLSDELENAKASLRNIDDNLRQLTGRTPVEYG